MDRMSSSLLINESPMQFLPSLGIVLENNNKAIFLQQLQYYLSISRNIIDGEKWVYNTIAEWNMIFPMFSESSIKRIIEELRTLNVGGEIFHIIKTKKVSHGGLNYQVYYTIDYQEMSRLASLAEIKKIESRRKILLSTIHMLNNYGRYANQYPSDFPESLVDLLKWAIKNDVKINKKWLNSDEGKSLMEHATSAKGHPDTFERSKRPVREDDSEKIACDTSNINEKVNMSFQEGHADTSECQHDTCGGSSCDSRSPKMNFPTIIQKTYTENTNIDLETKENKISSSGGNARTRDLPPRMEITEEELSYLPQPIQEVIAFYDKNINPAIPATPFEKEMLVKYCHENSPEWVIEAIKQALLNGKAHLGYIQGILHNWQEYGFGVMSVNKQNTSKAYKNVNRNKSGNASAEELQKGVLSRLKEMGMY